MEPVRHTSPRHVPLSSRFPDRSPGAGHEDRQMIAEQQSGAMSTDLRRRNGDPQGLGDLAHRQPFDVTQDRHGPVVSRELGDCRAQQNAKLCLHRRVVDARRPVADDAGMAPIFMERRQNFVERDIDEGPWASADLLVGGVADDPVDPGSEGRVSPERVDLANDAPERILNDFLGILLVPVIRTARR